MLSAEQWHHYPFLYKFDQTDFLPASYWSVQHVPSALHTKTPATMQSDDTERRATESGWRERRGGTEVKLNVDSTHMWQDRAVLLMREKYSLKNKTLVWFSLSPAGQSITQSPDETGAVFHKSVSFTKSADVHQTDRWHEAGDNKKNEKREPMTPACLWTALFRALIPLRHVQW